VWSYQSLKRIDYRLVLLLFALMVVSLLVISSTTSSNTDWEWEGFITPFVKKQIQFYVLGWMVFFLLSGMDYHKLREWTWVLYLIMLFLLVGLFFVPAIQNVHRWYRIGGFTFQPSEYAKLIVGLALSWFLEKRSSKTRTNAVTLQAMAIIFIHSF